jgi:hypothetical protein
VYVNAENQAEPLLLQRLIEMPLGVTNLNDTVRIEMNPFAPTAGGRSKRERPAPDGGGSQPAPQGGGRSR